MIFTPGSDYSAVLDACVLVPMALCDLLLRLAEEPALYRPLWSERILTEMTKALKTKLHRSSEEVAWRRQQMKEAFPEAMVTVPSALLKAVECIPDKNDRARSRGRNRGARQHNHYSKQQAFPKRMLREIRRGLPEARRFPDRPIPSPPATALGQTGRPSSRHLPEP